MFVQVITTEAHLAFAGSRTHSNNTAEMSVMIETLFFLGLHGLVARDANSSFLTPKMLLVFACSRFKLSHMCSWHLRANSRC